MTVKRVGSKFLAFVIPIIFSLPWSVAHGTPLPRFEDSFDHATISGSFHVCAGFAPVTAIYAQPEIFLCQPPGLGRSWIDSGTNEEFTYRGARHLVHICPPGFAMVGIHQIDNLLVCSAIKLYGPRIANARTQVAELNGPFFMRGCEPNQVMVGIHVIDNVVICQRTSPLITVHGRRGRIVVEAPPAPGDGRHIH